MMKKVRTFFARHVWLWTGLGLLLLIAVPATFGSIPVVQFNRFEAKPVNGGTRFVFKFASTPETVLLRLPDKRIRLVFKNSEPGFIRSIKGYSDTVVQEIKLMTRGTDLVLTFTLKKPDDGVGLHSEKESGIVTLALGPGFNERGGSSVLPAREQIRLGAERLLKGLNPPLSADIPFTPVSRGPLYELLSKGDAQRMQAAEAALYKGYAADAEKYLTGMTHADAGLNALILSRLGEALYQQQKYAEAERIFAEAERGYPEIRDLNPSAFFSSADCIARAGNLEAARLKMGELVTSHADKPYATMLLARLGDILQRGGHELEARAIYQNLLQSFPASKAAMESRMKLADRRLLSVTAENYHDLREEYADLQSKAGDFAAREQAAFKSALLTALYAGADEALSVMNEFVRRHPRGPSSQVAAAMLEDLLSERLQELERAREYAQLCAVAEANRDYLQTAFRTPGIAAALAAAYDRTGKPAAELALFTFVCDKGWGGEQEPFMLERILDDALLLENPRHAEWAASLFSQKYPGHRDIGIVRERLAELLYRRSEHGGVIGQLDRLLDPGAEPASRSLSYYYLGKSFWVKKNWRNAALAMEKFMQSAKESGQGKPLLGEAAYTVALARERMGDQKGAAESLTRALSSAPAERQDQYRYRLAEIRQRQGRSAEARTMLEKIMKEGMDPEWKSLAAQSLLVDEIDQQVREARRLLSKK